MLVSNIKSEFTEDFASIVMQSYLFKIYNKLRNTTCDEVSNLKVEPLTFEDVFALIYMNHALVDSCKLLSKFDDSTRAVYDLYSNLYRELILRCRLNDFTFTNPVSVAFDFRDFLLENSVATEGNLDSWLNSCTFIEFSRELSELITYAKFTYNYSMLGRVNVSAFSVLCSYITCQDIKLTSCSLPKLLFCQSEIFNSSFFDWALYRCGYASLFNLVKSEVRQDTSLFIAKQPESLSDLDGNTAQNRREALFNAYIPNTSPQSSEPRINRGEAGPYVAGNFDFVRKKPAYSKLKPYVRDITLEYEQNHPVCYNRDAEIEVVLEVLLKSKKNNVLLIGREGVGKTSLVNVLPGYFRQEPALSGRLLLELQFANLVGGTRYRGDLEKRVADLINWAYELDCILFIDEVHLLMASTDESNTNVCQLLKPALADSRLTIIGATTSSEFRFIEKDKAFTRRFDTVTLKDFSTEQITNILRESLGHFENVHNIALSADIIPVVIQLSDRYLSKRSSPDRELDLLDRACVYCHRHHIGLTSEVLEDVLRNIFFVPVVSKVLPDDLVSALSQTVLGQPEAVSVVANSLLRYKLGIRKVDKPLGVYMFQGPTGVGKTKLAEAMSDLVYHEKVIRFNMSEFSTAETVSRFLGTSAGFAGYGDEPAVAKVSKRPYSVVLFDEIEKAHISLHNIFLQILDTGFCEDSRGELIDFRNTFIIFTTNAVCMNREVGFIPNKINSTLNSLSCLTDTFSSEFLNRIEFFVPFNSFKNTIDNPVTCSLVQNELNSFISNYEETLHITVSYDFDLIQYLLNHSDVSVFGARGVKRAISQIIEPVLLHHLNQCVENIFIRVDSEVLQVVSCDDLVV